MALSQTVTAMKAAQSADHRLLVELRRSLLETHELVARSLSLMGGDPHSPPQATRSASPVPSTGMRLAPAVGANPTQVG